MHRRDRRDGEVIVPHFLHRHKIVFGISICCECEKERERRRGRGRGERGIGEREGEGEGEEGYLSQGRSADLIWLQYLATTILYYIKKKNKKNKRK